MMHPNQKTFKLSDGIELTRSDYWNSRPSWTVVFPDGKVKDFPAFDNPGNFEMMIECIKRYRFNPLVPMHK